MLRENANYAFGLVFARFMPLNDDLTLPTPTRMLGGAGPFDFSGEALASAIPLTIKIDNGAAETVNVDLSGVSSISAVTVAELFAAINTAAPTAITASQDATTGRIKLECGETEGIDYIQVYGALATISMFGQGKGLKFIKSDTMRTFGDSPTIKDAETITTTDARGKDTEIITDSYRKGFTGNIVDTAEDWELLALIEGGAYNAVLDKYEVPTSDDAKIYFFAEIFYSTYIRGTNKEGDLVGYVKKLFRSCVGEVGESTHERGWADGNYTVTGTSYKDENGALFGDSSSQGLTVEQFEAMDLENV